MASTPLDLGPALTITCSALLSSLHSSSSALRFTYFIYSQFILISYISAPHEPNAAAVQPPATDPIAATAPPLATAVSTSPPSPADQPHATAATATAVATLAVATATGPG